MCFFNLCGFWGLSSPDPSLPISYLIATSNFADFKTTCRQILFCFRKYGLVFKKREKNSMALKRIKNKLDKNNMNSLAHRKGEASILFIFFNCVGF